MHPACIYPMNVKKMLTIEKSLTEEELIAGCLKRKADAQKALYDRVSSKMLGVCFRYIQDREEAEHVMIGGMVKVFDKIRQFNNEGSFEGWIRRIMVNECLMYLRKNRAMSIVVEIDYAYFEPDYQQLSDKLESEDLMKLVRELPVGYRTVFNLYAIEGYNHAEIAEKLGISENTSKSQLSRARSLLKSRLIKIEKEDIKRIKNGNG